MKNKRGALGRNILLDTLSTPETSVTQPSDGLTLIGTHQIDRCPWQPRTVFEESALDQLANSIKQHGLMQPLVVRQVNHRYELIAGERRWRAAQRSELKQVPVVIQDVDDQTAATLALVENLQREDLNPLEQGQALVKLRQAFGLEQAALADMVGMSRSQVANLMRLDQLDSQVKEWLRDGDLDMGHARALLGVDGPQQRALGAKVVAQGLNVRQTETLVANQGKPQKASSNQKDADVQALEQRLSDSINASVSVQHNRKGKGKIIINYSDLDQLDGLISRLVPKP